MSKDKGVHMLKHSDVVALLGGGRWYSRVMIQLMLTAERLQGLDHESETRFQRERHDLEVCFLDWLEIFQDSESIPKELYSSVIKFFSSAIEKGSWSKDVEAKVKELINLKYS